jgi:hypothetical protein
MQRLANKGIPVQIGDIYSRNRLDYATDQFDIVYSAFVFHHGTTEEFEKLLTESFRVSRGSIFHLDLARSIWSLLLLWIFYRFKCYDQSRDDALLSIRRSFRRKEADVILRNIATLGKVTTIRFPPLYWAITSLATKGSV